MNTHDDLQLWHAQRTRRVSQSPVTYAQGWERPRRKSRARLFAFVLLGIVVALILGAQL